MTTLGKRTPRAGDRTTVYGQSAIIRRVRPFGTIDVETSDGRWYRISGLDFLRPDAGADAIQATPGQKRKRKEPTDA